MTTSDINSFVDFRANANTTTFTYAQRLISANRWLHKIWSMILDSIDGWDIDDASRTDYAIITTPLIAGQRDYTLPASLTAVKIKRIDITYDGTNYYKCEPWDSNMTGQGLGNNTAADTLFSKAKPGYDLRSNAIFVYPLATSTEVAAGAKLRVEYTRELVELTLSDITGGTKVPPVDEPFHFMIALGLLFDYASAKKIPDLKQDAWSELQDYEVRLRRQYGTKDQDTHYTFQSAYVNYE